MLARILVAVVVVLASIVVGTFAYAMVKAAGDADDILEIIQNKKVV